MKRIFSMMLIASISGNIIAQTGPANCPEKKSTMTQTQYDNFIKEKCEVGNEISTNPDNLKNDDCPVLKNDFEWRLKHSPNLPFPPNEFYVAYDANGVPKGLRNPFNDDDNNNEYSHIVGNHGSNYHPEDGWELLKVDFGALSNFNTGYSLLDPPGMNPEVGGKRLPYMILYNKHSGTFRFFGSLLGQLDGYETIRIELRIPKTSPNQINVYQPDLKATNLLSIQGDAVQPLDQETDENVMVVFAKATNNENNFFWFDIPVAYDPCLCNIRSQLDITFAFVKTANINLNGTINGALKTESKNDGTPKGVKVATTVLAAGASTVMAIKTGGTVINFQAYSDLVKLFKEIPGLSNEQKDNLDKLSNYVDCGLKFAKVLKGDFKDVSASGSLTEAQTKAKYKAANNILEANTTFMSSLANGCNKKDNGATTINATANLSGTWTEEAIIGQTEIKLAMPGSNWNDKNMAIINGRVNGLTIPASPTYNERLGTFALLETPNVDIIGVSEETQLQNGVTIHDKLLVKMKLNSDFKYTFNPVLNIDENKTIISCRYVGKNPKDFNIKYSSSSYYPGKTPTSDTSTGLFINRPAEIRLCNNSKVINDINNTNISYNTNSIYQLTSHFVPLDQFKDLNIVFYLDRIKSPNANGDYYTHINPNLISNFIFVQYKITLVSKNLGKDGKPITSIYYLTYPIKTTSNLLRVPRIIHDDFPITHPSEFHIKNCFDYKKYFYTHFVPEVKRNFKYNLKRIYTENKSFDTDYTFQNDEYLSYDGIVTISAKLSSTPGKKIKIYSTIGFELEPGAEISPDIELIVGLPLEKTPQLPQTYTQVSAFCGNNNKYKAQTFSQSAVKREKEEYEARQIREEEAIKQKSMISFKLSPNPTKDNFNVALFNNNEQDYSIALMDVTGKVLLNNLYNGKQTSQFIETNGLAAGIYFVKIACGNTQKTEKLIVGSNY